MKNVKIKLEELTCPSCIKKIESLLNKTSGITEAKVLFNSSKVKVSFNEEIISLEEIKSLIINLGYDVF